MEDEVTRLKMRFYLTVIHKIHELTHDAIRKLLRLRFTLSPPLQ
jgi:hypothetical protein